MLELDALAEALATDPMRASAAVAHPVLAAVEGDHAAARRHLEDAVDLFEHARAPFETACARLELAHVLRRVGRRDLAVQEARSAHHALSSMGAAQQAGRAAALLAALGSPVATRRARPEPVFGLSGRELEVLALLAQGLSNQRIADTLVLSRHTVNRHVANILRKMQVPSRAAAAALATRHNLL